VDKHWPKPGVFSHLKSIVRTALFWVVTQWVASSDPLLATHCLTTPNSAFSSTSRRSREIPHIILPLKLDKYIWFVLIIHSAPLYICDLTSIESNMAEVISWEDDIITLIIFIIITILIIMTKLIVVIIRIIAIIIMKKFVSFIKI
jgi:hypothetical protein